MFAIVLSTTARKNTICVPLSTTRRRIRAMIRTRDLPKSAGQSPTELALCTASVRAGKNPSDSNTAFNRARQHKDIANISAAQTTQKCHKGKHISIKGRVRYPQEGRTAQATDRKHPDHDMFNDGWESEETALCSVGRTKSAGSPTSRASPKQLMRRHSPRHAAPAPATPPPQAKMTRRQRTCRST